MASGDNPREEVRDEAHDPLSRLLIPLAPVFAAAFLLITAFTFYEVVMRYVFNAPTIWVHETTTALTALCFAFGGAYCLGTNRHIRVVLLYDSVSPRVRRLLDVAISLVGAAATASGSASLPACQPASLPACQLASLPACQPATQGGSRPAIQTCQKLIL